MQISGFTRFFAATLPNFCSAHFFRLLKKKPRKKSPAFFDELQKKCVGQKGKFYTLFERLNFPLSPVLHLSSKSAEESKADRI